MKIQLQNPAFFPAIGGIENYLYYVSKYLLKLGHGSSVLCSKHLTHLPEEERYQKIEVIRHPPYYLRFPASAVDPIYYVAKLQGFIKKKCSDIDIILPKHGYYCYASCNALDVPVVYVPPTIKPLESKFSVFRKNVVVKLWSRIKNFEIRLIEEKAMQVCDRLIVSSNLMKKLIDTYYHISNKKIRVIPLGVDIDRFRPRQKDRSLLKELKIPLDSKIILTVCRLSPLKRIDILMMSFSKLKDENSFLVIVGDGEERKYLERLSHNLHLEERVRFVGFRKDIERFHSIADVFVLPSIYETFGNALLEAMSSGVPSIGFRREYPSILTACDEVIENGETGYCIKFDVESLKDKLDEMIQDEELRERMGERAREMCEKRRSWEKYVENLLSQFPDFG